MHLPAWWPADVPHIPALVDDSGYWPWWLGALVLTAIAIGYWLTTGTVLGVSGQWRRVLAWRAERATERAETGLTDDPAALQAALLAATRCALGHTGEVAQAAGPAPAAAVPVPARRMPVSAQATFLAALIAGGLLAELASGDLTLRLAFSPDLARLGSAWTAAALALGGGFLVGLGTALAGGCTSGHGLVGCARLQPGSLVATATFFAAGAVVSLLLAGAMG